MNQYNVCFSLIPFLALIIGLQSFDQVNDRSKTAQQYYQEGNEYAEDGEYEKALQVWAEAQDSLSQSDFRISQSYVELATEERMTSYYEKASEIYFWGLEGDRIKEEERDAFERELRYLEPIIEKKSAGKLEDDLENDPASLKNSIRSLWEDTDLTPFTDYNERLLEHWERIAYAEEHYSSKKADGSLVIRDRGMIYIKYGKPYYLKEGHLSYNSSTVNELVRDAVDVPSFGTAEDQIVAREQRNNLATEVRQLHQNPRYEVWIYRDLTDDSQNTIYLFGSRDGTSSFKKINSVDDLIPRNSYRTIGQSNYSTLSARSGSGSGGNRNNENSDEDRENIMRDVNRANQQSTPKVAVSPALILQLMYYQQFAALDEYFGRAYNRMMDRYTSNDTQIKAGLEREFATVYGSKLIQIQSRSPEEKSEYENQIFSLPVENYLYRFADENRQPYVKLYSVVGLKDAINYDMLKNSNTLNTDLNAQNKYSLLHGFILKNGSDELLTKESMEDDIVSKDEKEVDFEIFYDQSEYAELVFEIHQSHRAANFQVSDNLFPQSLVGIGRDEVELPDPISDTEFTTSDVIMGYPGDNTAATGSDELNFEISHNRQIPLSSNLNIYYEVYNISEDSSGLHRFNATYEVKPKRSGFFSFLRGGGDNTVKITLNEESNQPRFAKMLDIETSSLEAGDYRLEILLEDVNTGKEHSKTIEFTIADR